MTPLIFVQVAEHHRPALCPSEVQAIVGNSELLSRGLGRGEPALSLRFSEGLKRPGDEGSVQADSQSTAKTPVSLPTLTPTSAYSSLPSPVPRASILPRTSAVRFLGHPPLGTLNCGHLGLCLPHASWQKLCIASPAVSSLHSTLGTNALTRTSQGPRLPPT